MRDILSDDTQFDFRSCERNTRRAKGVDSRVLIQLRVRSHTPRCYSESAAATLLTFLVPSEVIRLVVGQPPSPLVLCVTSPSRRRSKPHHTPGYRSDKV
jgi:hypothetical protein